VAARGGAEQGKGREGRRERVVLTDGPQVSAAQRKRKKKKGRRAAAGEVKWVAGLLDQKVR
jgi:hypothetical protein